MGLVRSRFGTSGLAGSFDLISCHDGRTRRRIQFIVVMEFDDFDIRQIRSDFCRELHHQDGTDGKVRRNEDAGLLFQCQGVEFIALVCCQARRTDDHVDAVFDAGLGVVEDDFRRREIDDDIRFDIVQGGAQVIADGQA